MSAPFHGTVIFVLLSAGCATQSANLAAAPPDHVAVEQQPAVTMPAPAAVPESPPPAALPVPAAEIEPALPEKAPVTPAATGMPEKERVPVAVVPPKPQGAKSQAAIAKDPVASTTPQPRPPAPRPQPPASPPEPQAAPPLALATLEQRLKDTSAIGVFTKLALKNQVDDLLAQFRARHEGSNKTPLAQLRQTYDQLLARVHDLLKSGDPSLAAAIMNSRESIWLVLADPVRFAKL